MSKKWELDLDNLDEQIEKAKKAYLIATLTEPRALSVTYQDGFIILVLTDEKQIEIRADLIQGLRGADPALIAKAQLSSYGASVHWEELDVDFSIPGLVNGIYGSKKWMEEIGN